MPSLGLNNKAVFAGEGGWERHVKDMYPDSYFTTELSAAPPTEEALLQNTLWPELHKLYGHGHELFTAAASPDSRLVASACRASDPASATVLLWDPNTWTKVTAGGRTELH